MLTPEEQAVLNRSKSPELPPLKRPSHPNQPQTPPETNYEAYRNQNNGAMTNAIAHQAAATSSSLQKLHTQLEQFEDTYADRVAQRIDEIPLRIEQKIAARLQQRQQARQQPQIIDVLDAFTIPEFDLPPAITPNSAMGCLPM